MTVDVVTNFALLAVVCLVFVVGVAVVSLVAKLAGGLPESLAPLRDGVTMAALPLAFAVAATSTLGSLYLSGVAKFAPCELCWFQRYCMYPLAVLLLFAWLQRSVRWWHWTLATVGLGVSTYHYLLERFPSSLTCPSNGVSCSAVLLWKFHFL
ncbi:MAG: disulfide bond formation protein B, partial [Actinomycetes bacterium]